MLTELVDACLATDPNERLANAADITRALTGASPVSGGHTTSSRIKVTKPAPKTAAKAGMSRWVVAVSALAIVAATIVSVLVLNRPRASELPRLDDGMIRIVGRSYMIGNNDDAAARPSHPVMLDTFGIGKHEVT